MRGNEFFTIPSSSLSISTTNIISFLIIKVFSQCIHLLLLARLMGSYLHCCLAFWSYKFLHLNVNKFYSFNQRPCFLFLENFLFVTNMFTCRISTSMYILDVTWHKDGLKLTSFVHHQNSRQYQGRFLHFIAILHKVDKEIFDCLAICRDIWLSRYLHVIHATKIFLCGPFCRILGLTLTEKGLAIQIHFDTNIQSQNFTWRICEPWTAATLYWSVHNSFL